MSTTVAALANFRHNLRRIMDARKISQRQLAEMAEMGYPYINRILKGGTIPSLPQCERIAEVLGVELVAMIDENTNGKSKKASCRSYLIG